MLEKYRSELLKHGRIVISADKATSDVVMKLNEYCLVISDMMAVRKRPLRNVWR